MTDINCFCFIDVYYCTSQIICNYLFLLTSFNVDDRQFCLRFVFLFNQVQQQPAKPQGAPFDGLAGALARALEERSRDIHGDESSASESSDDYDEEWEE